MKGYVYILQDEKGVFYVGSTSNIEKRIYQHMLGHTQTTARMKNPKLVLVQRYSSLAIARRIELRIKKLKRKDYIAKMVAERKIAMQ